MPRLFPFLLVAVLWHPATAQIHTPAEFLGYELGEAFTPHHRVVDYFEHVAAASSQVSLVHYGRTYEGRPLFYVVVSSLDNMARLEEIRQGNLQRAGLLEGVPEGPSPAIVWLSYNVHGNESVSTESAMATLHALVDRTNEQTQTWPLDAVVLIDPCMNPDGRDRYVYFYQQMRGRFPNIRPEAREHSEPWPGGRTNHYYFDLNRDWAWGTQAETQQRLPEYQRWMPHIHVDFHEQGVNEPYYFAPAAKPYHEAITPWQRELQEHIGRNHAKYFDARGWLFFTRQIFDLFYPGYGDTWPTFNGAIGMTYEQGGSGRAGLGILTAEGDTLTLRDRIAHHFTTSLSTVEVAVSHRERIAREFSDFFGNVPPGPYAAYVVRGDNNDQMRALARHLTMQGITFGSVTRPQQQRQAFSYHTGATGPVTVRPGDMIISIQQPRHVLTRVLFEPVSVLTDSLSYDITAWSLPYIYGVEAYALSQDVFPDTLWGAPEHEVPPFLDEPVAYVAEWQSFDDARLLAVLLNNGIRVRFTEEPMVIGEREYGRGTVLITRGSNGHLGEAFDQAVQAMGELVQQPLHPVQSSRVTEGVDFGSSDVPFLKNPRVAVLSGEGSSSYSLGELWHFFDQQLGFPVSLVDAEDLQRSHLYNFDVIVLPAGAEIPSGLMDRMKTWIREGGRLIALESAARSLAREDGFGLEEKEEEEEDETMPERRLYGERDRDGISERVTGAIFRVNLDTTHPLAFGYEGPYFTLKRSSSAFQLMEDGWNVGVLDEDAHVSGFVGSKVKAPLQNSLLFGVETMGRGEVVYLLDSPIFRGFWAGGRLLLANAVFLVGQRSVASF